MMSEVEVEVTTQEPRTLNQILNPHMPVGWRKVKDELYGSCFMNEKRGLSVIMSVQMYEDGNRWLHVSMSHRKRLPRYEEMCYLKRHWIGETEKAVMVFAPRDEHVNTDPNCLHLFCCLDADVLPDFRIQVNGNHEI